MDYRHRRESVRYSVPNLGGTIHAISGDPEKKSIAVSVNTTRDGILRIQFARDFFQAQNATNGQDMPFVILIDGKVANYTEAMSPASGTRALEIPFVQGQSRIEIIGTWLVPEFHTIAALTLGVSISLIFLFRHAKVSRRI